MAGVINLDGSEVITAPHLTTGGEADSTGMTPADIAQGKYMCIIELIEIVFTSVLG